MPSIIHYENVKHYLRLLDQTTDHKERGRIMNLLAEELVKDMDRPPEPKIESSDDGDGGSVH